MIMQANLFLSRLLTLITSAKSLLSCKVTYHRHWGHIWGSLKCLLQRCIQVSQLVSSVTQLCQALWSHGLQHARPPCPSLTPRIYIKSCPWNQWCHPTISSSVVPFSSCQQSFPASGSFQMSQFFASGGQSIGVSASAWVLPVNIQDCFPLGWTGWISLLSRASQEFAPTPQFKSINSLALSFLYSPTLTSIHDYWKNFD